MTTMETSTTQGGQKGELKLNLHIEQPIAGGNSMNASSEQKTESKSESAEPVQAFKQILSSLKDTQKYLPQQFNSFLESMEGKSMDDLKTEAMHLANKAQEEAKKRMSDVADTGKAQLESARSKAQDVMQKAQEQTSNLTGNLTDMVQTPLKATAEKTTGLANRGMEMAQTTITPYASMAKGYLPEPAKKFVDTNLANKSLDELRQSAMVATRQKLLGVTDTSKAPTVRELLGEVRGALWTGKLVKNSIGLTESAVEAVVGPLPPGTPKDAGNLTRVINLGKYVGSTALDYSRLKAGEVTQSGKDMLAKRVTSANETYVTPVMSSLPIIGRLWGKNMSEMKQMVKDQASTIPQQASAMAQKATDAATNMQQKATDTVQQGKQMANNAMDQGKQMASNAMDQGKQMAEQGKQMASNAADQGKQMASNAAEQGKQMASKPSASSTTTTTTATPAATPAVQVNVNTSSTDSNLKQFPQGGMPSVSLGGTTVTAGDESQTTQHQSSKKKGGKQ